MNPKDRKLAVGARPVNRRTAMKEAAARPVAVPVAARERVRAAHTRNRLGAPLADSLRRPAATRRGPTRGTIAGGVLAAGGAVGLFLAWLQASPLLGIAGIGAVGGGLFLAWRRGSAGTEVEAPVPAVPLVEAASAEAFDRALDALGSEVPATVIQTLADLKQIVLRVARHPAGGAPDEHFHIEDRLYINECLRRYLPDSLQAYLAVPAAQREQPLPEGPSAQALLLDQLALLRRELLAREEKLGRSASEALLRQQRFLKAKSGRAD